MGANTKTIKITDANRNFSALIQEVEREGVTFRLFRRDTPVAVLMPEGKDVKSDKARKAAITEMKRVMKEGIDFGGKRFSRDEMHDRT
ncbi:MAG: type II toxin-antitoxin system Phd/YefM family antitoxin [Rhizobiales bacterium]|nr:type II toxin-antitoxin system Phd/YefM family antitoxin [Hyphomicrobiales bacterium]